MKSKRQNEIVKIIQAYNVDTQDELISRLRDLGYEATQATISRDIKELKLVKVAIDDKSYKYAMPQGEAVRYTAKFKFILKETVIKVDYAGHMIVLKTFSGMAQAAAAAIDGMGWNEIVGTIAGDDTIMILMRSEQKAAEYSSNIKNILSID